MKIMRGLSVGAALSLASLAALAVAAQAAPRTTQMAVPAGVERPALVSPMLCDAFSQLNRLVVKRIDAFAQNHVRFSFPAVVTVSDQTRVQKAAKAVCALPMMPRKAMNCPVDLGVTYRLSFYNDARPFPRVVASATGCQAVTGIVLTRWAARSPHFWPDLGKAMGLKNPSWDMFKGSGS